MSQRPTVARYVVDRLAALGLGHVFGVPGDYSFPFDDAFEACPAIEWVACTNELNAAYAADGYARIRGAGLLATTYGVGELNALGAVMGSRAESVPVFHLVGHPGLRLQRARRITHHSLGDGDFDRFVPLTDATACASTSLTPENAIAEVERVIGDALEHSQPAHLYVAQDLALMPVIGEIPATLPLERIPRGRTIPDELAAAVAAVTGRLGRARRPAALLSHVVARHRLQAQARALLERARLGYATMAMDKAVLSEAHPLFLGMYAGATSLPEVREAIEGADCLLDVGGVVWTDLNTGLFSHRVDPNALVELRADHVRVGNDSYGPIWLGDLLAALVAEVPAFAAPAPAGDRRLPLAGEGADAITNASFYPRLQRFLRPGDVLVSDAGTCSMRLGPIALPADVSFQSQALWGSIGWATGAGLGTALADRTRRTVVVTGDGAHQMTATEIGTMGRYGVTPVVFVLNNGLYGIEEALSRTEGHEYDRLAAWNYAKLPEVFGCRDWYSVRVETVAQLSQALEVAGRGDRAAYVEIVLGAADTPHPLPDPVLDRMYEVKPRR